MVLTREAICAWLDAALFALHYMFFRTRGPHIIELMLEELDRLKGFEDTNSSHYHVMHMVLRRARFFAFAIAFISEIEEFLKNENENNEDKIVFLLALAGDKTDEIVSHLKQHPGLINAETIVEKCDCTNKTLDKFNLGKIFLGPMARVTVKAKISPEQSQEYSQHCEAVNDFVNRNNNSFDPVMFSMVINAKNVHDLHIHTFDELMEKEVDLLWREWDTQSTASSPLPTPHVPGFFGRKTPEPGTSESMSLSQPESDTETYDSFNSDIGESGSDSGSCYIPARQEVVRLRSSPIPTHRVETRSRSKLSKRRGNSCNLSAVEMETFKRFKCRNLKVVLKRITTHEALQSQSQCVRFSRKVASEFSNANSNTDLNELNPAQSAECTPNDTSLMPTNIVGCDENSEEYPGSSPNLFDERGITRMRKSPTLFPDKVSNELFETNSNANSEPVELHSDQRAECTPNDTSLTNTSLTISTPELLPDIVRSGESSTGELHKDSLADLFSDPYATFPISPNLVEDANTSVFNRESVASPSSLMPTIEPSVHAEVQYDPTRRSCRDRPPTPFRIPDPLSSEGSDSPSQSGDSDDTDISNISDNLNDLTNSEHSESSEVSGGVMIRRLDSHCTNCMELRRPSNSHRHPHEMFMHSASSSPSYSRRSSSNS